MSNPNRKGSTAGNTNSDAPPAPPFTDEPSYDSDEESSPRLEGDTSDDVGREELD